MDPFSFFVGVVSASVVVIGLVLGVSWLGDRHRQRQGGRDGP
jgi:hypothetical protein